VKPVVFITQWMPEEGVEMLKQHCQVSMNEDTEPLSGEEIIRRAGEAHVLLYFVSDHIDGEIIAGCPNLKVAASFGKGYDNLDLEACTRRNICATINPHALTDSTADLAIALILAVSRNIIPSDRFIREGSFRGWHPTHFLGRDFHHATLGIIGLGDVGEAVARRAYGFDVRILYHDLLRRPGAEDKYGAVFCSKDRLLAESHFIVVSADLRPDNRHLIGSLDLRKFRKGSYLINVGRGSLVDEQAVAGALEEGILSGYASDVYELEDPLFTGRPKEVAPGLICQKDKTVLTSHIGTGTREARSQLAVSTAGQILAALRGEKPSGALNDVVLQPLI